MKPLPALADRQSPGLSQTLPGERHPRICQACGQTSLELGSDALRTWEEHDAWDQPQHPHVYVVLCARCSDKLIDPHPRLYSPIDRLAPVAGVMDLCIDCAWRDGVRCTFATMNPDRPLRITHPQPDVMHVCRSPRRLSGFVKLYKGPPSACSGFEQVA